MNGWAPAMVAARPIACSALHVHHAQAYYRGVVVDLHRSLHNTLSHATTMLVHPST